MEENYFVRPYRPGDEEEIVQLLQLVFEGWPHFDLKCSAVDHWRWKHQDSPLKPSIVALGVSDGKIIGCVHRIPKRTKIGDDVFVGCVAGDVAVHPDFQGMGVHTKMDLLGRELEIKSGIDIIFGVTDNPILLEYYKHKRDARTFFSDDDTIAFRFERIKDMDQHLHMMRVDKTIFYKFGFHLVKTFNKVRSAFSFRALPSQDFSIRDIRRFDEDINVFWDKIKDCYTYVVEKTKDYMNWRYCDPRGGEYLVKIAEKEGRILGYIVLRVNRYREEYPEGYIVDLMTLHDRVDVAHALARDAVRYFDAHNINVVRCQVVKNHPYERIFRRHGFFNSRYRIFSLVVPSTTLASAHLDNELRKTQKGSATQIHFVYGDYDNI